MFSVGVAWGKDSSSLYDINETKHKITPFHAYNLAFLFSVSEENVVKQYSSCFGSFVRCLRKLEVADGYVIAKEAKRIIKRVEKTLSSVLKLWKSILCSADIYWGYSFVCCPRPKCGDFWIHQNNNARSSFYQDYLWIRSKHMLKFREQLTLLQLDFSSSTMIATCVLFYFKIHC